MQTKLSKVKAAFDVGDYQGALYLAAKFPSLGEQRSDIKRAHESYANYGFYKQLGHDIGDLRMKGVMALADRYGWALPIRHTPAFFRSAVEAKTVPKRCPPSLR